VQRPKSLPDPSEFEKWLFTEAKTEDGKFPDWPFLRDYAKALIAGRKGLLPDQDGEMTGHDLIVLKRRQILISWVTAAWFHWTTKNYPFDHGAVISSGKTTSSKQGRRIRVIAENDGLTGLGVDVMKYPLGGEITIHPSTQFAALGDSLKKLHFDEFSFHRYARPNLDAARPAVSNSRGQIVITSTSNPLMGNTGAFVEEWESAPEGSKRFYGRDCRPDQPIDGAWFTAERKRYSGPTFNVYYPENPEDAFIAHEGLVFPEFDVNIHVGKPLQDWRECKYRILAADPGGGDATAMLAIGIPHDESSVQVYGPEYYKHGGSSIDEYTEFHSRWQKKGKVQAFVIGETGGATIITTLRRMGLPAERAELKPDNNREWIRWLLENKLLRVDPSCENLIKEFKLWRWKPGTDEWTRETFMTSVGGRRHHDLLDTIGYGCARVVRQLGAARPQIQESRKKAQTEVLQRGVR